MIETRAQHAVAVEIELTPVRRLQKSITFVRKEFAHYGMPQSLGGFHLPALPAGILLQLAARGEKRLPDRDPDIFSLLACGYQFSSGHDEIKTHVIPPLLAMGVTDGTYESSHDHVTADDSRVVALELSGFLANLCLNNFRQDHIVGSN